MYGFDIGGLAVITSFLTQLFKNLLFKNKQKKLATFLPFILGTLLYAVYAAVRNLSFVYLIENYVSVLEHGISVGAVATLYYVLYEQFVRVKDNLSETESVISTLIEGFVPSKNVEAAAKAVAAAHSFYVAHGIFFTEKSFAVCHENARQFILSVSIYITPSHCNAFKTVAFCGVRCGFRALFVCI